MGFRPTQVAFFFFFNDTATTEIYTLSLHDALPICRGRRAPGATRDHHRGHRRRAQDLRRRRADEHQDRKSTRLNSSHANISYAVFCLKKKKKKMQQQRTTSTFDYHHITTLLALYLR